MLKTQKLIIDLGWVAACKYLSEELFITCKEYDNFIVFNYNQIFSPEDNDYVMECRSLQLTKDGEVASRAYPRFFNFGQRPDITGKFVFEGCRVLEKVDGSLIRVYWNKFDTRWEIATRGTAFAESQQEYFPTFRQAVLEDGFGLTEQEFQDMCDTDMNKDNTYVFEYCSLKNRIVTAYLTPVMYLITVVENETGKEREVSFIMKKLSELDFLEQSNNIRYPKEYTFADIDSLLVGLEKLEDLKEGFVAQDVNGLRVKFKNSLYLKLHKMRGDHGFTPKKIASIVAENEQAEVLAYFPEYAGLFDDYEEAFRELLNEIYLTWERYSWIESQKEFALAVKDLEYSAIMFSMRKTGFSFQEIWETLREEYKVDLILNKLNVLEEIKNTDILIYEE